MTKPRLPAHATCVFKGEIFEVYQWPQPLFDGTTATFEMARRQPNTTVLALDEAGNILYAAQEQPNKPPYLSLFGGRVEVGEDPLQAAQRELLEETGLVSDDWALLYTANATPKVDWPQYLYLARNCRQVASPQLDAGEKLTLHRCTLAEFFSDILPQPNFHRQLLQELLFTQPHPTAVAALLEKLQRKASSDEQ